MKKHRFFTCKVCGQIITNKDKHEHQIGVSGTTMMVQRYIHDNQLSDDDILALI